MDILIGCLAVMLTATLISLTLGFVSWRLLKEGIDNSETIREIKTVYNKHSCFRKGVLIVYLFIMFNAVGVLFLEKVLPFLM